MAALSILSRAEAAETAGVMLFACGERLAVWHRGTRRIVDAATGQPIVTLASPQARIFCFELDGPLAILVNNSGLARLGPNVELWDMSRGAAIATLFQADARVSEIEISRSAISCVRSRPEVTRMRFDRSGALQQEVALAGSADCLLVGTDGPQTVWNYGWRADEIVDPATGVRIPLERGTSELRAQGGHLRWTLDEHRAHLALYSGGTGRTRVWRLPSGSLVRGPWDDRDLRAACFVGDCFVLVARDATFVTYTTNGEIVASGGRADPDTPRPGVIDDRHVALRAPNGCGIGVWDVHDGVEVAHLETIEGLASVEHIAACNGRIALSDGNGAVVLQLDPS